MATAGRVAGAGVRLGTRRSPALPRSGHCCLGQSECRTVGTARGYGRGAGRCESRLYRLSCSIRLPDGYLGVTRPGVTPLAKALELRHHRDIAGTDGTPAGACGWTAASPGERPCHESRPGDPRRTASCDSRSGVRCGGARRAIASPRLPGWWGVVHGIVACTNAKLFRPGLGMGCWVHHGVWGVRVVVSPVRRMSSPRSSSAAPS
jgi:hypothetical protein